MPITRRTIELTAFSELQARHQATSQLSSGESIEAIITNLPGRMPLFGFIGGRKGHYQVAITLPNGEANPDLNYLGPAASATEASPRGTVENAPAMVQTKIEAPSFSGAKLVGLGIGHASEILEALRQSSKHRMPTEKAIWYCTDETFYPEIFCLLAFYQVQYEAFGAEGIAEYEGAKLLREKYGPNRNLNSDFDGFFAAMIDAVAGSDLDILRASARRMARALRCIDALKYMLKKWQDSGQLEHIDPSALDSAFRELEAAQKS